MLADTFIHLASTQKITPASRIWSLQSTWLTKLQPHCTCLQSPRVERSDISYTPSYPAIRKRIPSTVLTKTRGLDGVLTLQPYQNITTVPVGLPQFLPLPLGDSPYLRDRIDCQFPVVCLPSLLLLELLDAHQHTVIVLHNFDGINCVLNCRSWKG